MKQHKVMSQRLVALVLAIALVAFFLLPAVSPPRVGADTEVGGQLTSHTTWILANSPYIVTASVVVNSGVTLTIEPGVTVKFEPHTALQVDGELVARGTEASPIIFTSNQPLPGMGDWVNILFTDTAVDAQYDGAGNYLSSSILQYSIVEYGGGNNTPALKIVSSSPFIDHSTIRNNASSGIYVDQGSPKIANSTISGNSATYGGGIWTLGGTVTLNNSTLSNNSATDGGGIWTLGGTVTLNNSTLSSNSSGSYGGGIAIWGGTVTLHNSTFSGNSAYYGGGIFTSRSRVTLNNSTLSNNSAYYGGGIFTLEGAVTLNNSTLSNNSASAFGGGIYAGIYNYGGTVTLTGNTLSNNSAWDGGGIYASQGTVTLSNNTLTSNSARSSGGGIDNNGGTVTLNNNTLNSNWASSGGGIAIRSGTGTLSYNQITSNAGGSGIYIAWGQPLINHNNIQDNTPYDVYNASSQGFPDVDATNNWWGTADEATIQAHIYDWFDDASLGVVDYAPYLTSASQIDTTPPTTPVVTDDGNYTTIATQFHATWSSSDPESGIAEYQYAIGASPGGTDVVGWTSAGTATEVTKSGLILNWGITYYFAVKAKNGQGLWSEIGVSNGITVSDDTSPVTPIVIDDGDYTTSAAQLQATWSSSDPESGIAEYQYAIGTSPGGTDVVSWTSAGTNTEITKSGLSLNWGTTYYFAVKAKNGQGLWSEAGMSNGITVSDDTSPVTPIVIDDGDYTTSATQLQATWSSADPESGIAEYQYAIGASPGGTNVVSWTSAGTNTGRTKTGLSLTWGGTYYFAVKAKNGQGLWSEIGVSNGITVSAATPPTTPVVSDEGDYTTNTTQLHSTWASSDPESGITEYQFAIGTSPGGTDILGWTSAGADTEVTHTGLNLTVGTTYYFAVKAKNGQGLWSEIGVSNGITVSAATPPTTPVVSDEGDYTTNTTQLQATWSASDPESGIAEYQFAIGTSPGGTDILGWTSAGTDTGITHTGLNLTVGTTYYFAVKAKNGQGLWSEVGVSNGITVRSPTTPGPSPEEERELPSWLWIAIGVFVLLIVGVLLGRRLGRR